MIDASTIPRSFAVARKRPAVPPGRIRSAGPSLLRRVISFALLAVVIVGRPSRADSRSLQASPQPSPTDGLARDADVDRQYWERSPTWSSTGTIAFVSNRDGAVDIYAVNGDGAGLTNLTRSPELDVGPAWAPDGSRIAFLSERSGSRELWVMNADGSEPTAVTSGGDIVLSRPSWSPDGRHVVFVAGPHESADLWTIDVATRAITRLTEDAALNGYPSWSPDGTHILFTSNRVDGNLDIYRIRVDGTDLVRMTRDAAEDGQPLWSPDGSRIAFFSNRGGNSDIYFMDVNGGGSLRVTRDTASDVSPAWSPDGTRIVFSSDRQGTSLLYVMAAAGGAAAPLVDPPVSRDR